MIRRLMIFRPRTLQKDLQNQETFGNIIKKHMKDLIGGTMKKTIITVVGKDTVGIIAKVCTYLAENGINILMIVDTNGTDKPFGDMADELAALGEEIGVVIKCQKEEIFDKMHRI